ncbi:hypothetical protein AMTR_s00016p00120190 [Amborella trichopoda]|uniref:Uncharacterized protein n=1 Tax=Amborella trichopoda TaxID=13333 RepID=W1PEY0_AMBTC|nr:hypothetical protein AMTR_s00016p00120190 [Amborella trichopoda]
MSSFINAVDSKEDVFMGEKRQRMTEDPDIFDPESKLQLHFGLENGNNYNAAILPKLKKKFRVPVPGPRLPIGYGTFQLDPTPCHPYPRLPQLF